MTFHCYAICHFNVINTDKTAYVKSALFDTSHHLVLTTSQKATAR